MPAWTALARHLGIATLSGVISGVVVGGLLGRVVMRISGFAAGPSMVGVRTEAGNPVGDVTFAGTLALVFFVGIPAGLLGGVVYGIVEPWLRRLRPWHGLAYGSALLAAVGFTVLDPFNFDFNRFGPPPLNLALFAALFVIFGVATAWLFDRLRALSAMAGTTARVVDVLSLLALGPAGLAVALGVVGAVEASTGNTPVALVIIGALALAAIVRWLGLPRPLGYVCLIGALLLGATRTVGNVLHVLYGF